MNGDINQFVPMALLGLAILFFCAGGVAALLRGFHLESPAILKSVPNPLPFVFLSACLALGALIWHAVVHRNWIPLDDNFEAFCALGVMLAAFWFYVQLARPIVGLDWFLRPMVVLMLVCAGVFGQVRPSAYRGTAWAWTHRLSSYGGAMAFAVAASVGGIYLIASARLRHRRGAPGPKLSSLERLEHFTDGAVTLGFALLTLGVVTGLLKILHEGSHTLLGEHPMRSPKVILALTAWLIYALALHTPITPAIRGRKSAMLSIVGFLLIFLTVIAAQFMPEAH